MRLLMSAAALAAVLSAETKLGKPLTLDAPLPIAKIMARPTDYSGKIVQVQGKVTEVCQMMGCWMALKDNDGGAIRIKVNDGDIVFPKTAVGKSAIAEGKLQKLELTREQAVAHAKHEAEEQGRKFDPASIKGGATVWQIAGTGAVLED